MSKLIGDDGCANLYFREEIRNPLKYGFRKFYYDVRDKIGGCLEPVLGDKVTTVLGIPINLLLGSVCLVGGSIRGMGKLVRLIS